MTRVVTFFRWPALVVLVLAASVLTDKGRAVVLWSNYDSITVKDNNSGTDLLGGAIKRDDTANDTLYFKFRVDPNSDETTEPYFAAFELFEDDTGRLAVGNAPDAWAYSVFFPGAQSSGVPPAGYLDLKSAHPDTNAVAHLATYQCPRRGEAATFVFKIQYVPSGEDLVTVWLNPDLGPGATEISQPESLATHFNANASFDEIRLRHGGNGGGWTFSDMAIATSFTDFVDSSSDEPGSSEINFVQNERSFQFRFWPRGPGLPHMPVNRIQQTPEGYIWLSAGGEITRFDGLRFVPLYGQVAETNMLAHTFFADSEGALWISLSNTLQRWQDGRAIILTTNDGLPDAHITELNEDADGSVWIGTPSGLITWKNGRFAHLPGGERISTNVINAIYRDKQNTMWVAAAGWKIFRFADDHFSPVEYGSAANWITGIHGLLVDSAGRIWLATGDDNILCRDKNSWHHYRIPKRITGSRVNALAEEPDGTIWAGGASGLFIFSDGKFVSVPSGSRMGGNTVESMFVDRDGVLWVGTDEGLNRLQRKCLFPLGQSVGLGFGPVQSLAQVSPGVIWAARTGDGIYRWDGRSFSRLRAAGLSAHNSQANALLVARDGVCWVASLGGLLRYKDPVAVADEVRWFELPGENVISLAEDFDGSLLAGTQSGKLWRLREGRWIAQASFAISNAITAMVTATDHSIWIGTAGRGLIKLEKSGAVFFGKGDGLGSSMVHAIYEDSAGVLWVGTSGGLSCRRSEGFFNFTAHDGLPDDAVSDILEDGNGRLWVGTAQGIACLHKDQLADFAAGRIDSLHPKVFGLADGMPSEECISGCCPSALKSQLGLLWIPTKKGVTVIAPQNWPVERPLPRTVIEQIFIDGVPVNTAANSEPLRIPPGKHRLELSYTGLRFDAPESMRFRYKLDGWDPDWIDAGTSRNAVYNFVPPGPYTFRVLACNSDGNWGTNGAEIQLIFTRYFWQSGWFITFAGITLLLAVGGTVRLVERQKARARLKRLEQERVLERERTRIAQDLHDEMGAKLCRISFLSEHARRDDIQPAELHRQIKSISDDSREVLHSLDEIVWAVNPENDTLEQATSYLSQFAQDYFSMTGVECELVVPPQMPSHPVSSQVRHHLYLAVREALANILKHSGATRATMTMACRNGNFEISVQDNGKGFDWKFERNGQQPQSGNTHDGLRNLTKRFEAVGGQCSIHSVIGKGTTINFALPLEGTGKRIGI